MKVLFTAPHRHLLNGIKTDIPAGWQVTFLEAVQAKDVAELNDYRAVIDVWVCNPSAEFVIDNTVLDGLPNLRLIVSPSTGTNHIDKAACAKRGIPVKCLLDNRPMLDNISASAEHTFLLLLAAYRRLTAGLSWTMNGRWHDDDAVRGNELQGKLVGLVGFGRIGKRMSGYCAAFGARTIYHDPKFPRTSHPLADIFRVCDAVVVCCTYDKTTHGLITTALLDSMKPGAVLVNTARGEVIDHTDILEWMDERPDVRVAFDVLPGEVNGTVNPLPYVERGAIITPHMAGTTIESQTKAATIAIGLVKQWEAEQEKAAA